MRPVSHSPLLRFFREADIRAAVFLTSVLFLGAGIWVGHVFDLWNPYVEDPFDTICLTAAACPAVAQADQVKAEFLSFGLLALGGVAASIWAVLSVLRDCPEHRYRS